MLTTFDLSGVSVLSSTGYCEFWRVIAQNFTISRILVSWSYPRVPFLCLSELGQFIDSYVSVSSLGVLSIQVWC